VTEPLHTVLDAGVDAPAARRMWSGIARRRKQRGQAKHRRALLGAFLVGVASALCVIGLVNHWSVAPSAAYADSTLKLRGGEAWSSIDAQETMQSADLGDGSRIELGKGRLTALEATLGLVVALAVISFVMWHRHRLVLALVSPEIAHTAGIDVRRLNLYFLLVFALTIALGLRYLGVLLVGSLVIIPAATAKRLARSLRGMLGISVLASIASTALGTWLSFALHRTPGSMIVLVAATFFFLSLLRR